MMLKQQQQQQQQQQQKRQPNTGSDTAVHHEVIQIQDSDDGSDGHDDEHGVSEGADSEDGSGGKGVAACDELLDHGKSMRTRPSPPHPPPSPYVLAAS